MKSDQESYFKIFSEGERKILYFSKSFGAIIKSVDIRHHFHIAQEPCHGQDLYIEGIHIILTDIAIVLTCWSPKNHTFLSLALAKQSPKEGCCIDVKPQSLDRLYHSGIIGAAVLVGVHLVCTKM